MNGKLETSGNTDNLISHFHIKTEEDGQSMEDNAHQNLIANDEKAENKNTVEIAKDGEDENNSKCQKCSETQAKLTKLIEQFGVCELGPTVDATLDAVD